MQNTTISPFTLVTGIFNVVLSAIAVMGNALILTAIWKRTFERTSFHLVLSGLAFSDLCTGLFSQSHVLVLNFPECTKFSNSQGDWVSLRYLLWGLHVTYHYVIVSWTLDAYDKTVHLDNALPFGLSTPISCHSGFICSPVYNARTGGNWTMFCTGGVYACLRFCDLLCIFQLVSNNSTAPTTSYRELVFSKLEATSN